MNVEDIFDIATSLGDAMTDEQAQQLMDQAKSCCSVADMRRLKESLTGPLYTLLSEFEGEIGGFNA